MYAQTLQAFNSIQNSESQQFLDLSRKGVEATLWTAQCEVSSICSIEVLATEDEIVLQAIMPNVVGPTLDIQVTSETICIAGEQQKMVPGKNYCDFEFSFHPFKSIIPLPELIEPNAVIAQLINNILTVRLQKSGQTRQSVQLQCEECWEFPVNQVLAGSLEQSFPSPNIVDSGGLPESHLSMK